MTKIYCTNDNCTFNEIKEGDVKGICRRTTVEYDDICFSEVSKDIDKK